MTETLQQARPRQASARTVAASLFTGGTTALALAFAVFPGADESTITGSLLVGSGVGWAMLARKAGSRRWAGVPAWVMGATGVVVMVTSPQNDALTTLNWVWPPVLVVMVTWIATRMRASLTPRGSWLLAPVLAVLAATTVGATFENVAELRSASEYPAPGRLYDVGGHRLHLDCRGEGGPTVVLLNGLGEVSASWARVLPQVETRVCAYDRAGQAWSDDVASPQDAVEVTQDLHALLAAAGEQGPYVLVGHSLGGPYALTYAAGYPDQVAGMVLLDSSSPDQRRIVSSFEAEHAIMRRAVALLPTVTRVGLGRLFSSGAGLPEPDRERVQALTSTARALRSTRDEVSMIPTVLEQSQALATLGDTPLVVLTASAQLEKEGWQVAQDELATLSGNHRHTVVESTHEGLLEDAGGAAETVSAIEQVVASVRTATPLR